MNGASLSRNTLFSTIVYVIGSLVGVILVPVLLSHLGSTLFGIYVLCLTTVSYSSLASGGLTFSFVRAIAVRAERDDADGIASVVRTGLVLMVLFGAFVALLMAGLVSPLQHAYHIPAGLHRGFAAMLAGATVAYVLACLTAPLQGLLTGLGRLDLAKSIELTSILLGSGASVAVVVLGYGLTGLALAIAIVAALTLALYAFGALRVAPGPVFPGRLIDRPVLTELWRYGYRIQAFGLAGMVNRSVDRLSIGVFRTPSSVAAYDVADRAAFSFVFTGNAMAQALLPRMSAHLATDALDDARRLYQRATTIFALAAASLAAFAAANAPIILATWLGPYDSVSSWALVVLAIGYGVSVSCSAATIVCMSQEVPTLAMRLGLALAAINIALSVLGAWTAGVVGAAVGSAVSGAIGALAFAWAAEHVVLRMPPWTALGTIFKTALMAGAVACACAALTSVAVNRYQLGRPAAAALLIAAFLVQVSVTLAGALALRIVPVELASEFRDRVARLVCR